VATCPVFNYREVTTVDHSIERYIGESLLALLEKTENLICSVEWST